MTTVMTLDIATKIESAEIDMLSSRLEGLQAMSENPMQVQMKKFGSATAFSSQVIAGPAFNTVKGLTNTDQIDEILSYYQSLQIPCRFEITPAQGTAELFQYLSQKGFYHSGFHTALYSIPKEDSSLLPSKITVRKLKENEFDIFADIYVRGFNMPSFTKDGVRQNNEILYNKPGWHFFIAEVQNTPASIGVLYIHKGIASLAASATLPEFQRKGCHTALIQKRIKTAIESHCNLLVGQARFGSGSQNNMERAHMKIAYTKSIWTAKDI
ncbi:MULTISPECIES: GNAT family N-acetyltransferase [Bacillus cereus group]|uniref:GNAT family N-acetyltransferase n=1 Tax=Bacillus cereus group TaxID=86661 RepID=UPI000BEC0ED6|nr:MULTISPECIES: GNAT family N-acetyltransferase [Bacillus cereus group]MBJ7929800.1 GNAT family N-acetyltransferase [Bacillus cereus group sp. N31]PEG15744.1 GNAT family N-acetyltransferase [Bacillus toyonensis]PEK55767.1 GNAT family N-acetyltransferase [Bacillus toyonensis]PGA06686.1 GNAT family N-acetyltransferase [Bacillus toyonensis]PGB40710.1 GNAT family N-acetyltransferase [Bacillus toyonensis]